MLIILVKFNNVFLLQYDRDGNGSIDIHELATMLRENNEVSEKLLSKLLSFSDKNRDGKVDVHEFTAMMLNKDFKVLFGDYVNRYLLYIIKNQSNP